MRLFAAIITIYTICSQVKPQIIYPDNLYLRNSFPVPRVSQGRIDTATNTFYNPHREALDHNNYVDDLVSSGISKLAISINNFYLNHRGLDNVIFSPVSIAGALALVLLGSNGKTFDEIGSVMGLAGGTDINSNSEIVHESLGKLFSRLDRSSDLQIKIAAAIFVQNNFPIRDLYKQTSERIYNNEILNVDFRTNNVHAQRIVNTWVSNKTNGKIKSILAAPPPEETNVIIASALYFNGAWEKQFWEGITRRRPFYPNGRKTHTNIEVEMMSNGGPFPYYKDRQLNCDIIGFPYKGNATTMYVIIPQDSNVQRLKSFEASLTSADIVRLVKNTQYTQSVVMFPKMKMEASSDLKESLHSLGVRSLFNPFEANLALLSPGLQHKHHSIKAEEIYRSTARPIRRTTPKPISDDLSNVLIFSRFNSPPNCTHIFDPSSNMSKCEEVDENTQKQVTYKKFGDKLGRRVTRQTIDTLDKLRTFLNRDPYNKNVENPGLYADQVLHKVYIEVTEKGTEAAAGTAVSLTRGGDINIFRADVPFLFFIWHEETQLILFWGTVYEPTPHFS